MSYPIKSSTKAATCREEKSDSVDKAMVIDAEVDTSHSVTDEFGYPMWAHPADEGVSGNTSGSVQPVSTDGEGDDSEGN